MPRLSVLLAASVSVAGVKVAVQIRPSVLAVNVLRAPLGAVMSALLKSLTFSLKVMVTVALSPALSALSLRAMLAVGALRSMA